MQTDAAPHLALRPLAPADLDAVVALDAAASGRARRAYFERRLAVALRQPALHVQLALDDDAGLAGCILARRMQGEFGRRRTALRIEVVGVRADRRGEGLGARLLQGLADHAQRHGLAEIRTVARWDDHGMLRWLHRRGFALAPDLVLDCRIGDGWRAERPDALELPAPGAPGREPSYAGTESNDFERVARARCDVRPMRPDDLPQILRIDRAITGEDRSASIAAKLQEALDDAAIRVSVTAWQDGVVAGFLMARADLGDFGRVDPVAVLDTLGVDPASAHRGVGHALVSALFDDLAALQIDAVETAVRTREQLALLGFLHAVGFERSQRLAFARAL